MSDRLPTSIATVSLGGSLEDKLTAIAAAGFDGFEVFEPDFVAASFTPEELAVRSADLGLTIDLYQPFRDLDSVDPDQFARNLIRAQRKFDLMARMGCDMLLVCSSPLPKAVRDDAQLAEQLHALADIAHARGIRIAYEALAWGTHVNTYRHAWQIVADVDHPALGTCLDSFHILSRGDDPSGIRDIPGDKIFFLQLADAPRLSMDVLSWSRHHRNFPGQGNFDLAAFGAHVQATGYAGPWSLEIFNDTFRQTPTDRTAVDAHRSLLYLQEEVAKLATPTVIDAGPALFTPPARPAMEGVVSLRLAAGPDKATELQNLLATLGFRSAGRHRDQDLQLFRHGPLTIVVDGTPGTVWTRREAPELPALTQIGVRAQQPEQWARRAQALEVPAHEVELPGAEADPDGDADVFRLALTETTSLDLRGPDSGRTWRRAFSTDDETPDAAQWFTGVDHVSLSVPAGRWDGVLLALRSVFGMQPTEGVDLTDAMGLMHTQVLATPDTGPGTRLRIALTMVAGGPVEEAGARRGGISHVAFACRDIFATAEAMRADGYVPLPISPNYYDDIGARFDLPAERLEAMARHGILYDAAADGEFYHLFTRTVGADLFFEVVQRVGGYAGYGDVNAAVRLAAQLRAEGAARAAEPGAGSQPLAAARSQRIGTSSAEHASRNRPEMAT